LFVAGSWKKKSTHHLAVKPPCLTATNTPVISSPYSELLTDACVVFSRYADLSPRAVLSPYRAAWWDGDDDRLPETSFLYDGDDDRLPETSFSYDGDDALQPTDGDRSSPPQPVASRGGEHSARSTNFDYDIETVTIVSGIDRKIHLARLCESAPETFGVHSQGQEFCSFVIASHWLFLLTSGRLQTVSSRKNITWWLQKWMQLSRAPTLHS
jgi:hypothetical protein